MPAFTLWNDNRYKNCCFHPASYFQMKRQGEQVKRFLAWKKATGIVSGCRGGQKKPTWFSVCWITMTVLIHISSDRLRHIHGDSNWNSMILSSLQGSRSSEWFTNTPISISCFKTTVLCLSSEIYIMTSAIHVGDCVGYTLQNISSLLPTWKGKWSSPFYRLSS